MQRPEPESHPLSLAQYLVHSLLITAPSQWHGRAWGDAVGSFMVPCYLLSQCQHHSASCPTDAHVNLPLCMQAYQRAIEKAVKRVKEEDGEVHALDLGCGAGLFAMMAAKAGATSVVACDMHEPLCVATRKASRLAPHPPSPIPPPDMQELALLCMLTECSISHPGSGWGKHHNGQA